MKCDDCERDDDTVEEDNCPYAEELYGDIVPCKLCRDCYHNRCMEI